MTPGGFAGAFGRLLDRSRPVRSMAGASALSLANSLAIAIFYAHVGGAASYGVYQVALSAASVASFLTLSGSASAAVRAAAQGRVAAWPLFRLRLPFCFAASGLLLAVAGGFALAASGTLAAAFAVMAVTLPLYFGADVFPAHLIGARRFGAYVRFQAAVQALTAAAVIGAVVASPHAPWLALLGMAGTTSILQFVGLTRLRDSVSVDASDLAHARRMSGITALGTIDARLDVLLAGSLLGTREAGLVAVARTLPVGMKRLWEIAYQPLFVAFAAATPHEGVSIVRRYRRSIFVGMGAVALVAIAAAPFAVPTLFGAEFDDAVTLTQLLLAATALSAVGAMHDAYLRAQNTLAAVARIYALLPMISLLALPPLITVFGIEGIGVEALGVAVVYTALTARATARSGMSDEAASAGRVT